VLDSITRGYLAPADWLRGELVGAERALSSSIAEPRAAKGATLAAGGRHIGHVPRAHPGGHHRAPLWRVALQCQAGGCGRFHRHCHLRVTPHCAAGSYRPFRTSP